MFQVWGITFQVIGIILLFGLFYYLNTVFQRSVWVQEMYRSQTFWNVWQRFPLNLCLTKVSSTELGLNNCVSI